MKGRIVQRSPGSWQLIYDLPRGADGKRKQAYKTVRGTRREAEKELRRRMGEVDSGAVVAVAKGTIADHLTSWLAAMKGKVEPTTHEGLETVVRAHLIPHLGHRKLDSLQPTDVRDFIVMLETKGNRAKGSEGKALAGISVHRIGCVLRQALEDAVTLGVLPRNPARIKLPPPKTKKKRILSQEEMTTIMQQTQDSYLHTMILLGLTTGARRGELLALRWQDVNLETGEVAIGRSMAVILTPEGRQVKVKSTKTDAGTRTVFLPAFARTALLRHRGKQSEHRLTLGPVWQEHDLIVCQEDGNPVRPSTASCRMKQKMDAIGLPGMTLHGLRHSFASLVLANGGGLKTLQAVMGHTNIQMTLGTYGHLMGGEQEQLADNLNTVLKDVMGL